jgi:hypothetical protein
MILHFIVIADPSNQNGSFISNHTLQEWISETKKKLLVDKKKTNAYNRSLSSAYDARPSSIAMGTSGAILLFIAVFFFVSLDLINFFKYVQNKQL